MIDVTEHQLTSMLKRNRRLLSGDVISAKQNTGRFESIMSKIFDLELTYSAGSRGTYPAQCLMKVVEPEMFAIGKAEVSFYEFASTKAELHTTTIPEIYGTLIDEQLRLAVVLMEDKGHSFIQSEWPVPLQLKDCRRAVRTIAQFHSCWWGSEEADAERPRHAPGHQNAKRLTTCAAALFDVLGDALPPQRRTLIEDLIAKYPTLHASRLTELGRQTVVHGDAHLWNFLIPEDESASPTLIDWQLWGIDFGVADLAYMIALHWFPERRARYEKILLKEYVDELHNNGVVYEYESALTDYRFSVAGLLTKVVIYASVIPANIWWPHLERAFLAFDDLECLDLLDSQRSPESRLRGPDRATRTRP